MKILLDTNVVLDLLLDRKPFSDDAAILFSMVERGLVNGYLCATTITTIFYLMSKVVGWERAKESIRGLLTIFEIAPVNRGVLDAALKGYFEDFEDAVLYEAAQQAGADLIITRNECDFKGSVISVHSPSEAVKIIPQFLEDNDRE